MFLEVGRGVCLEVGGGTIPVGKNGRWEHHFCWQKCGGRGYHPCCSARL